jgi:hypothetical protein
VKRYIKKFKPFRADTSQLRVSRISIFCSTAELKSQFNSSCPLLPRNYFSEVAKGSPLISPEISRGNQRTDRPKLAPDGDARWYLRCSGAPPCLQGAVTTAPSARSVVPHRPQYRGAAKVQVASPGLDPDTGNDGKPHTARRGLQSDLQTPPRRAIFRSTARGAAPYGHAPVWWAVWHRFSYPSGAVTALVSWFWCDCEATGPSRAVSGEFRGFAVFLYANV